MTNKLISSTTSDDHIKVTFAAGQLTIFNNEDAMALAHQTKDLLVELLDFAGYNFVGDLDEVIDAFIDEGVEGMNEKLKE